MRVKAPGMEVGGRGRAHGVGGVKFGEGSRRLVRMCMAGSRSLYKEAVKLSKHGVQELKVHTLVH